MIAAMMSEFEFERLAPECKTGQLMSETDTKDGLTSHKTADVIYGVSAGFRVAGTVREKDAVRFQGKNVFGRSLCGDNCYPTALAA